MGMTGQDALQNLLRQKQKPTPDITTGTSFDDWNAGNGPGQYDQWLGPHGYLMRDDINGAGQTLKAWTPGSQIDPYWQSRIVMHAQGTEPPGGDQNAYRDLPQFAPPARTSGDTPPAFAAIMAPSVTAPSYQYTPAPIALGGPSSTTGGSTASGSTGLLMTPEISDQARARILELLQTPRTVDPTALRDSPEMQGVYLMAQRAEERDRAALAERAAAGGWSGSGGFEGGLNALRQQRGETEMQMMGTLAGTYMDRQREDLQRGIDYALNQGQFEAAQSLQRDLAALNAQIEQERIGADVGMNNADLALRAQLGQGDLALRSQLGQGDLALRGDQLGFDYAQLQYEANRDAMLAALRR
jgi:hypothetical protein